MIDTISNVLVNFLLKHDVIKDTEDERAYYKYGMEISISSILGIVLITSLGIVFQKVMFALIYTIMFMTLRQITGGYHAKTYFKCNLTMCLSFCTTIILSFLLKSIFCSGTFIIHLLLSIAITIVFCPVANENKPIKPESKNKFKIFAVILSVFFSLIGYYIFQHSYDSGIFIIATIIMINVLIVLPKLIEGGDKYGKYNCRNS